MGVLSNTGITNVIPKGSFSSVFSGVLMVIVIFFVVAVISVVAFLFIYKKKSKEQYKYKISLFKEEQNTKLNLVGSDIAKEIKIPGTNVKVLYWKNRKIYAAYPTRSVGNNIYAYKINRFGELTNFNFVGDEKDINAKIEYDHRDQTYAYLHLQQLINRNYRQKNVSWWKQNLPLIVVIVSAVLLGAEMWFFFSQSSSQLHEWTTISHNMKQAADVIARAVSSAKGINSGVVVK